MSGAVQKSNHGPGNVLSFVLAAIITLLMLVLAVYNVFYLQNSSNGNSQIRSGYSAVIVYDSDNRLSADSAARLAEILENAGMPSLIQAVEDYVRTQDYSGIISNWINWKASRNLNSNKVWLLSAGLPADYAAEMAMQWDTQGLVLIGTPGFQSADDWHGWSSHLAGRWPDNKPLIMITPEVDNDSILQLFEIMSSEDVWLFEGYSKNDPAKISVYQSTDTLVSLSQAEAGLGRQPMLSSSYAKSILLPVLSRLDYEVLGSSDSQSDNLAALMSSYNRNQNLQKVNILLQMLLLSALLILLGLTSNYRRASQIMPNYNRDILISIIYVLAILAVALVIIGKFRTLVLPDLSYWLLALTFLATMIILLPEAWSGIAHQADNKPEALVRKLVWATDILMIAVGLSVVVYAVVFARISSDLILWLLIGAAMAINAKLITKQGISAGVFVWIVLPLNALLILMSAGIVSQFLV